MAEVKYNFLGDNFFTTYQDVKPATKYTTALGDVIDIGDWGYIGDNGIIYANNNTGSKNEKTSSKMIVDNTEEIPISSESTTSSNNIIKPSKGSEALSKIIDEVSNEEGYEKLKDPHIKYLLMLQAKRESSFNPSARSSSSSASGYFQFIDGTRKKYSSISKDKFLNDPKEQVKTAFKYLKDIHNSSDAIKLKELGYNDSLITALGWWYPRSMRMILEGKKDFSLGGYSIKKAFEDYG